MILRISWPDFRRRPEPVPEPTPFEAVKAEIAEARAKHRPVNHLLRRLKDLVEEDLRRSTDPDFVIPGPPLAASQGLGAEPQLYAGKRAA